MENEIMSIELKKEGIYYTIYINGEGGGCGNLEDMVDDLPRYIKLYMEGSFNDYL